MRHCFVFGAPRSGTTYLQSVLGACRSTEAHIGYLVPEATCHIVNQDISTEVYNALAVSVKENIETYLGGEYNSRFRALENWWRAPLQLNRLQDVIRRGARARPDWFVYKEPFLSLCPDFVWNALPEAKIIYIYRDGRDVANSLVQSYDVLSDEELTHLRSTEMRFGRRPDDRYVPWWVEEGRDKEFLEASQYGRAIWMWNYMIRRCATFFDSVLPAEADQILRIPYEELVGAPSQWEEVICDFLGRSPTRAMRRQLSAARTNSIGKHRRRSASVIDEMESIGEEGLRQLDYL